ncbi:MAG: hypothetical protein L0Y38_00950 [Methylococcaceae bacterium]|nr:hypothetical protein [Methylococcaceae bacterium]
MTYGMQQSLDINRLRQKIAAARIDCRTHRGGLVGRVEIEHGNPFDGLASSDEAYLREGITGIFGRKTNDPHGWVIFVYKFERRIATIGCQYIPGI